MCVWDREKRFSGGVSEETEKFFHFTTVNGVTRACAVRRNTTTGRPQTRGKAAAALAMTLIIIVTAADNDSDASLIKISYF